MILRKHLFLNVCHILKTKKKKYEKNSNLYASVAALAGATSCEGFLDTAPYDPCHESTLENRAGDAQKFLIGCYDDGLATKISFTGLCSIRI